MFDVFLCRGFSGVFAGRSCDLKMLSIVDDHLRQIFPDRADQAFGGLNILLRDPIPDRFK
jgi:hypothetical protein